MTRDSAVAGCPGLAPRPDGELLADCLRDTGVENLWVITSGPLPPNSAELLDSPGMAELAQRLKHMADVIVFDSPPVLAATDAALLSQRVDGVILVVDAGHSRRAAIRQAVDRLRRLGANLQGTVLNRVSGRDMALRHFHSFYTRGSGHAPARPVGKPGDAPNGRARRH